MIILWLTNFIIPEVADEIGIQSKFVNEGWLSQMFHQLSQREDIEMNIVCCNAPFTANGSCSKFNWYTSPQRISEKCQENLFTTILQECRPDVVHIWGSEFSHSHVMLLAADRMNLLPKVIISIQGIIHIIAHHYLSHIPHKVLCHKTIHDIVRHHSLINQKKVFKTRGLIEKESLKLCHHVIGRTTWDYYCVKRINPNVHYHSCNETLRNPFYDGCWDYNKCKKHSIFVSQASYPIKGFHFLLKALPHLIKRYPDLHVFVAGADITKSNKGHWAFFLRSGYGKYIHDIIMENGIEKYISFLGPLNAEQMKEQYLRANVFVSPSVIENSPNSVCEAMILGCPVISSDVGGVRSLLDDKKEGLTYPYDEFYMLEYCIDWVFSHPREATEMGLKARERAKITHAPQLNLTQLLSIYHSINNYSVNEI